MYTINSVYYDIFYMICLDISHMYIITHIISDISDPM